MFNDQKGHEINSLMLFCNPNAGYYEYMYYEVHFLILSGFISFENFRLIGLNSIIIKTLLYFYGIIEVMEKVQDVQHHKYLLFLFIINFFIYILIN